MGTATRVSISTASGTDMGLSPEPLAAATRVISSTAAARVAGCTRDPTVWKTVRVYRGALRALFPEFARMSGEAGPPDLLGSPPE